MREVIVRDLAKCINCETCLEACRARHGRARMTMSGPRFGRYQLPDVCRNCPDTPCVQACHLDGMQRHNGKTFISDACRGCTKCVDACRYGVVKLLPRQHTERRSFFQNILSQARTSTPETQAYRIKTDESRCVQCGICSDNCPAEIPVRDYARKGHTVQDSRCFGCGLCVAKCPRGTLRFETYPTIPTPKFRADKCDLCRGYGESNCVKQCPTGALLRVQVNQDLERMNANLYDFLVNPDGIRQEEQPHDEPQVIPIPLTDLTPLPAFLQTVDGD
ncbi:MAG: 4Fe-4S dicluster domain-containing protein [Chloroflexi bacterium]|nr:4Fe-4S dicluster domain-containing protein [Chloroflexota bacterium]